MCCLSVTIKPTNLLLGNLKHGMVKCDLQKMFAKGPENNELSGIVNNEEPFNTVQ